MNISKCLKYSVQLLRNIVNGEAPDVILQENDLEELWRFSELHNISNLLYLPLKKNTDLQGLEVLALFEQSYYKNVIFATQQHQYLEQISEAFENKKIKYMPMKGSVLKHLYPDISLRTSCDIDIYIGDSDAEKAKNIMLTLGFDVGMFDNVDRIPDTYHIGNRFHVELHRKLMQDSSDFKGKIVCDDIEDRLEKIVDRQYEYKMTDEDFYVFMIIHIAKHIKSGGIGVRAFFDVWLYLEKFGKVLNWKKIEESLVKADLSEFNKNVLALLNVWAGKEEVSAYVDAFQNYIANSGVLGTSGEEISEQLYNQGKVKGKFSYYCSIIFLPVIYMKQKYKILDKLPVLLPFCWIHRAVYTLCFRFKSIRSVMHHFDGADVEGGKKTADLKKQLGL